ncbi:MAG: hypothetical protein JXR73_02190 [Candidatus Omnitrophica bacterium]|nr:hypothetical protein [Candidatus Omnitrophota bacterium]
MYIVNDKNAILKKAVPPELQEENEWTYINVNHPIPHQKMTKLIADEVYPSQKRLSFKVAVQAIRFHQCSELLYTGIRPNNLVEIVMMNCLDPTKGEFNLLTSNLIEIFDSYTEMLLDGDGIRIYVRSIFEDIIQMDNMIITPANMLKIPLRFTGIHVSGTPTTIKANSKDLFQQIPLIMEDQYDCEYEYDNTC